MLKIPFGKTGVELSRLGFGCMRLPILDEKDPASIDYDQATAMLRLAVDRGVNYVDTAWPYHGNSRTAPGQSEPFVGRALKDGYRDKVYLATKLPTWLTSSVKEMNAALDTQLKRLDTSYIDFYLAHNINNSVWPAIRDQGLFQFLDQALKDGRIKYAGFSFHDQYRLFEETLNSYDWSFCQIQYNYLDVNYQAGRKGLELAAGRGLGVAVMEPMRGGFLINHMPGEMKALLYSVRPDWSLVDWALRWLWSQQGVGLVLSGMSTLGQVEENLRVAETASPMTPAETEVLERVAGHFQEKIKVSCTACGYCLPCPEGVNIPKNFSYYNDYFLMDSDEVRDRTKMFFNATTAENEKFSNCVRCRDCEEKCPQNLPISDLMGDVARIFN